MQNKNLRRAIGLVFLGVMGITPVVIGVNPILLEPSTPKNAHANSRIISDAMAMENYGLTKEELRVRVAQDALEHNSWYYGLTLRQRNADEQQLAAAATDYADYVGANTHSLAHGPSGQRLNLAYDKLKPVDRTLKSVEQRHGVWAGPKDVVYVESFKP